MQKKTQDSIPRHRRRHRRRTPAWLRVLGVAGGILLFTVGITVAIVGAAWPEQVERSYAVVQKSVSQWRYEALGDLPQARLGSVGGTSELDQCDGTFTMMKSYESDGVPPVWAAHNYCGGDVVLTLELGQQVEIEHEGETVVYEVVDTRDTPKKWVTTQALVGIKGDFALQTCYHGENRMKFIGLRPVTPTSDG